jgi:hypothetical protein
MNLNTYFDQHIDLGKGIRQFFEEALHLNLQTPTEKPIPIKAAFKDKDAEKLSDIAAVYFAGKLSDKTFNEDGDNASLEEAENEIEKGKYDSILVFGVELTVGNPTRSRLSEITRWLNRRSLGAPVTVVFRYQGCLAFSNSERLPFVHQKKEGEKVGKISLLRDLVISNPHTGHLKLLEELAIEKTGKNKIDSFEKLYTHWQQTLSVSLLNKKFYQELSNWYFWATKHVVFPGQPTEVDAYEKDKDLEDLIQEHKATHVIRMLTRLLFVWFIKEKKLIPEDLFDLKTLQKDILNNISPFHETGLYVEANKESIYYKSILQNLFFATLNCPIEGDYLDTRKRGFRGDGYGTHRGIDWLMRYKKHFKNPDAFLAMVNQTVPFLNGGLFECLDDKTQNLYIDGFSDQMTKGEQLIVPDYLFFGTEEEEDLSKIVGITDKKYKNAAVKGLINILKSYKFTITENTPIEEDVALDPELLGKVFENLLASYNPETKTTARKQTGSFYTPREIVNYMVDESLIAYLKNAIPEWGLDEETLDTELHVLTSFDGIIPFSENPALQKKIITALSTCTILDPACGSGAFPMGILQKMVHILQKLDPDNTIWKDVQLENAEKDSKAAFEIEDKKARGERLQEISEAFDQNINDPDYARKLFLIENCIYGVDIQPIATQISKLRFFISLVVEQKVNPIKGNFGIRPLPNLETKFVAANTLIGIDKPSSQVNLFDSQELKDLEYQLKKVRSKLFSARTKETKLKYRELDKSYREQIASKLKSHGWQKASAEKLAGWDPYDQNASSPFFDPEWMFDIRNGFDLVIGNPPYILVQNIPRLDETIKKKYSDYKSAQYKVDLYHLFIEKGIELLSKHGVISYITPNTFAKNKHNNLLRKVIFESSHLEIIVLFYSQVFENVSVDNLVFLFTNTLEKSKTRIFEIKKSLNEISNSPRIYDEKSIHSPEFVFNFDQNDENTLLLNQIEKNSHPLQEFGRAYFGIQTFDRKTFVAQTKLNNSWNPVIDGGNIFRYRLTQNTDFVHFMPSSIKSGGNPEIYRKKRIVVRQIGKYPEGAICPSGLFTLNTVYNIYITGNQVSLFFLLAQINSPVVRYHWLANNSDNKATFPKIKKAPLESIPIKISEKHQGFTNILIEMTNTNNKSCEFSTFLDIVDALILDLHFSDHMKELKIDVLQNVEIDINDVMKGREFENLSDEAKEKVIEQLHAKWSDPENEVVKRMGLFKERSPEILKVILES